MEKSVNWQRGLVTVLHESPNKLKHSIFGVLPRHASLPPRNGSLPPRIGFLPPRKGSLPNTESARHLFLAYWAIFWVYNYFSALFFYNLYILPLRVLGCWTYEFTAKTFFLLKSLWPVYCWNLNENCGKMATLYLTSRLY